MLARTGVKWSFGHSITACRILPRRIEFIMATAETISSISIRKPQGEFRNEPFTDFSREENARAMREALSKVRSELGREYNLIIGGRMVKTSEKIKSLNPARPAEIVGIHKKAGAEHVELAMQAALKAFEGWKNVPTEERASLLLEAAEII